MLTDSQIQSLLRKRGFAVPLIVIGTWTRTKYTITRNKLQVERWLLHKYRGVGRPPRFPQWLAPFDIQIVRIMRRRTMTPRLKR